MSTINPHASEKDAPQNQFKSEFDSITVLGRRYQDRHGNTYHSVRMIVNGNEVGYVPHKYGYEDHYQQTATDWLYDNGFLPTLKKTQGRPDEALWRYGERTGVNVTCEIVDCESKKEL